MSLMRIVVERSFDTPQSDADMKLVADRERPCLAAYEAKWTRSLLSTFPDLGLHVDDVYWMGNDDDGYRVSVRWTAVGTHRGWSLYGEPTGRRVHLWGIQQLYVQRGLIVEDWMLFNEFDVL